MISKGSYFLVVLSNEFYIIMSITVTTGELLLSAATIFYYLLLYKNILSELINATNQLIATNLF